MSFSEFMYCQKRTKKTYLGLDIWGMQCCAVETLITREVF